ncbi:Protein BOBBER 2 [Raphanus sativus]|nr:Protein BOBBER 2 [Raphanus sativus]
MANISDMQEETSTPFSASFDRSNPLGFVEKVLEFIGNESDFLLKDTSDKEIATAVTATLEKKLKEESVTMEVEKQNMESLKPKEPIEVENPNEGNVTLGEVPNKGNGLDFQMYSWTQTRKEVTINIPVHSGTNSRSVTCKIDRYRLKVCLNGNHTIIDGALFDAVKPDDCFWYLDKKVITVLLTKHEYGWWKYCVKGEPEIDTKKVKAGSSKLDDLDPETRSTVEKMMFDQRQKHDLKKKSISQHHSQNWMKDRRFW